MNVERRKLAAQIAEAIAPNAGIVLVLIANESEPRIEIDAAVRSGDARTEAGGLRLAQLAQRLSAAVETVTREMAEDLGAHTGDAP